MRYLMLLLLGLCLCSCSLDDEYAEKIEQQDDTEEVNLMGVSPEDKLGYAFMLNCRRCIRGDLDGLDELVKTYMQSFRERDFSPRFFYQRSPFHESYEQCITKAATEGKASRIDPKYTITGPILCAFISREFYAQDRLTDGAMWMRRILSLQGRKQGFETAGNFFIRDNKTYDIGIRMLGEAAQLGNSSARVTLMQLVSTNPALRQTEENTEPTTPASSL